MFLFYRGLVLRGVGVLGLGRLLAIVGMILG